MTFSSLYKHKWKTRALVAKDTTNKRQSKPGMNYYDEEIQLKGNTLEDSENIQKDDSSTDLRASTRSTRTMGAQRPTIGRTEHRLSRDKSFRHDDDDDDNDISDISKVEKLQHMQRPIRSSSMLPSAKIMDDDTDLSETESDDGAVGGRDTDTEGKNERIILTPSQWEKLALQQEIKDLFPYILKYTPQNIGTIYNLQPFIPEYVPAVGDVDAFLKVSLPQPLQMNHQKALDEHLRKMGLFFLDEPSGQQSEPSLLYMKLRSVLSGSGSRSRSTTVEIPVAKSMNDVDKWIEDVEAVHRTQSSYETPPRKDMETIINDWPHSYSEKVEQLQLAYKRYLQNEVSIVDYVRLLSEKFEINSDDEEGSPGSNLTEPSPLVNNILNVQTLFCLYLAANESWERRFE